MRTTVTLDADVESLLRRAMRERGITFKEAINEALRRGLGKPSSPRRAYRVTPDDLGAPLVPLESALRISAAWEDEEIQRKLSLRTA